MRIPLSVLDLAPINRGETATTSIAASVALAQRAEEHGYERVWYAEHHNIRSIASSATSVLIAHIAAHTETIRLGSGGIMLPNHSPLVIAEQFGTLAELHPGRIDLGLGRAPGSDTAAMRALRRDELSSERFPQDVVELQHRPVGGPGAGQAPAALVVRVAQPRVQQPTEGRVVPVGVEVAGQHDGQIDVAHLAGELPAMVAAGRGRVLITSSIASMMPGTYQAVYNASKSFTQSFAEALRAELKDTGVTVTALMPGPTDTNFFHRAEMDDTPVGAGKKDDPALVAEQGIKALLDGARRAMRDEAS